jgi:hypothetical protein
MGTLLQKIPPGVGSPIQLVVLKQPRKCPELQASYKTVSAVLQRNQVASALQMNPHGHGGKVVTKKSNSKEEADRRRKELLEGDHKAPQPTDPRSVHRSLRDAAGDMGHDDMGQRIRDGAVFAKETRMLQKDLKHARRKRVLSADDALDRDARGERYPLGSPTDTHRSDGTSASKRFASGESSADDRSRRQRSSGKNKKRGKSGQPAPTLADFYKAAVEKQENKTDKRGSGYGSGRDSDLSSDEVDSPIERMSLARRGSVDSQRSIQTMRDRLRTEEEQEQELKQRKRAKKGRIRNIAAPAGAVKADAGTEQDPDWSPPRAGYKDARQKLNDLGIYDHRFKDEPTLVSQNNEDGNLHHRSSSTGARRNSAAEAIPHGAAGKFRTREHLIDDLLDRQQKAEMDKRFRTQSEGVPDRSSRATVRRDVVINDHRHGRAVSPMRSPVGLRDEMAQPPPPGTKNDKLRPRRDKGH